MDWKRVFDPRGLNWWLIAAGIGTNLLLVIALLIALVALRMRDMNDVAYVLLICGGAFLAPMLTAILCARLAGERYMTYALYPLIGFLVPVVPGALLAGGFALLVAAFGVLGAINGAHAVARQAARRRRATTLPDTDGTQQEDT
ncbi:MAG: hypothetical protein JXA09_10320 [Anaerolineae bacterium]|nr:hypothetical protein [Anaerolineae bacterium]